MEIQTPEQMISPGAIFAGCVVERKLGSGGMGEIFLAKQTSMDRFVALKILSEHASQNETFVQRFLNESLATAKLEHPNIVIVHDAGTDRGRHYLNMQYVDGQSLDKLLLDNGAFREREALSITIVVARALAFAWERHRMLHRDVKPANIMRDAYGGIKLLDLGLARRIDDPSATATGIAMGTPMYMSPEQAQGSNSIDFRSDMYSLGATLFHLLTGSPPFPGKSAVEILTRHALDKVPNPQEYQPDVSNACFSLLKVMMAKQPEQRHEDWQELIGDLERVRDKMPPLRKTHKDVENEAKRRAEKAATQASMRTLSQNRPSAQKKTGTAILTALIVICTLLIIFVGFELLKLERSRYPDPPVPIQPKKRPPKKQPSKKTEIKKPTAKRPAIKTPAPKPVEKVPVVIKNPVPPAPVPPAPEPEEKTPVAPKVSDTPATAPVVVPPAGKEMPPNAEDKSIAESVADAQTFETLAKILTRYGIERGQIFWHEKRDSINNKPAIGETDSLLKGIAEMPQRILASFQVDLKKKIEVELRTMEKITIFIDEVNEGYLNVTAMVDQGEFKRKMLYSELSFQEQRQRAVPADSLEAGFFKGLLFLKENELKKAEKLFIGTETQLGKAYAQLIGENLARQDFTELLEDFRLPTRAESLEKLAQFIRERDFSPQKRLRYQGAVEDFLREHGKTRFAKTATPVLKAFDAPEEAPLPALPEE